MGSPVGRWRRWTVSPTRRRAMTPREQAETLVELVQLASRVAELRWRVLAAADRNEIGAKDGSTSTAAWLARATRENRSKTNGDLRGARALDEQRFAVTRSAFAAGRLTEDQVWVIIRAVEDLPAGEVSEEQRVTAQEHLVMLAAEHDAKACGSWRDGCSRCLPRRGGPAGGRGAGAGGAGARERTRFAMRDNGDGTSSGWFKLPTLQAQMLGKAVQAFAAPAGRTRCLVRRRGQEALPGAPRSGVLGPDRAPADRRATAGRRDGRDGCDHDGARAAAPGAWRSNLDTGGRISPSEARRMACNAGLVPAVLGTRSTPLDLGRTTRLHNGRAAHRDGHP